MERRPVNEDDPSQYICTCIHNNTYILTHVCTYIGRFWRKILDNKSPKYPTRMEESCIKIISLELFLNSSLRLATCSYLQWVMNIEITWHFINTSILHSQQKNCQLLYWHANTWESKLNYILLEDMPILKFKPSN